MRLSCVWTIANDSRIRLVLTQERIAVFVQQMPSLQHFGVDRETLSNMYKVTRRQEVKMQRQRDQPMTVYTTRNTLSLQLTVRCPVLLYEFHREDLTQHDHPISGQNLSVRRTIGCLLISYIHCIHKESKILTVIFCENLYKEIVTVSVLSGRFRLCMQLFNPWTTILV